MLYLINRAHQGMRGYAADVFAKMDLTVPTFRILLALSEYAPLRFGELVTATSLEPPTLSRYLDQLETEGFVRRKRVPNRNSKSVEISLTARGIAKVDESMPHALECEDVYLEGLTEADAEVARRVLTRIYDNVRRADAERDVAASRKRSAG